jgi:hypothetical protein
MVESVILVGLLLGLGILVYYTYKRINTIEKEKQAELDKEIAADWEELEAELAMEV